MLRGYLPERVRNAAVRRPRVLDFERGPELAPELAVARRREDPEGRLPIKNLA